MKTCDLVYSITIQGTFPKISRVLSQNYIGTLIDIKEKCLNIITCTDVFLSISSAKRCWVKSPLVRLKFDVTSKTMLNENVAV